MEKATVLPAANPALTTTGYGSPSGAAAPTHYIERIKEGVTVRCFLLGLLLSAVMAVANAWALTAKNVSTVGGIQMPFGAIFALMFLILFINLPMRWLGIHKFIRPFSAVELLTMYVMMMFAAMISTTGCDNQFMTMGPSLFYFHTPENRWADLFYSHVPKWFAPGWDGRTYQTKVIDPLFDGNLKFQDIPWHAWMPMLAGWSIFLLLTYSSLFFLSLMFRKQWIEREALAFPLVQLPLQMVEVDKSATQPSAVAFWTNKMMWAGFGLAFVAHFFNGMNSINPDWPGFPVNHFGGFRIIFPDKPWNALGALGVAPYYGAIGIAYLLTREVSFSFWFFYLFSQFELVICEMIGIPSVGLPKAGIMSRPSFLIYQGVGGWVMMAGMLVWMAREHLMRLIRAAFSDNRTDADEPFSARTMVFGFILSFIGLLVWGWLANINLPIALIFFLIFIMTSIVLTRMVIEGGFLFPQAPFYPLEWMTTAMLGYKAIGPASLTSLAFVQPTILLDTRTNVLPGFLHVMKIADELRLDRKGLRWMLVAAATSIILTLGITYVVSLWVLYSQGGHQSYTWFSKEGPKAVLGTTATYIKTQPGVDKTNLYWIGIGAAAVWFMMVARSRFLWFPLHPLGFITAAAYPITQLWFAFFLGWLIKTIIMRFGGSDTYVKVRPFMIGLILGNLTSMIIWMLVGFKTGTQIGFWCA